MSTAASASAWLEHLPGRAKRVELECAVPSRHGIQGHLGKLGRRARPAIPAVGIGGNAVVAPAPQQPVNRLPQALPIKSQKAISTALMAVMTVDPPWYWSRIKPPITASMSKGSRPITRRFDPFVKQRLDRLFLPLERRLADARQSGIRAQANEQIISQPGVGQKRFEADDLHAGSPGERQWNCGRAGRPLSRSGANIKPGLAGSSTLGVGFKRQLS